MPSTNGAVSQDDSPGPNILKNLKNTDKDMEVAPMPQTLEEISQDIASNDPCKHSSSTHAVRLMCEEEIPPITAIIEAGIVNPLVSFLLTYHTSDLQYEALWALMNITSGTSENVHAVVAAGAVAPLIKLLESPYADVAEMSVYALGNIAHDEPQLRDLVINSGVVNPLLALIRPGVDCCLLRSVTSTLCKLYRNKIPFSPFEICRHTDKDGKTDACWSLCYLTDGTNDKIQELVKAGVVPFLVENLRSLDLGIVTPALRAIGNIVTGNDGQTDEVIAAGTLRFLPKLLQHYKMNIMKEAAWIVSNITAGNFVQIQAVINANLIRYLNYVMIKGDFRCQREAAWAITNFTSGGSTEQIVYLLKQDILEPFCNLLDASDAKIIMVVLDGISNILETALKINEVDRLCQMIEECKGLDKIESLQNHENHDIYKKALGIIDKFFSEETEDVNMTV